MKKVNETENVKNKTNQRERDSLIGYWKKSNRENELKKRKKYLEDSNLILLKQKEDIEKNNLNNLTLVEEDENESKKINYKEVIFIYKVIPIFNDYSGNNKSIYKKSYFCFNELMNFCKLRCNFDFDCFGFINNDMKLEFIDSLNEFFSDFS